MKTSKLRFAALRRVSTEQQEKEGESLRTQMANITKIVEDRGDSIVEWYGGQEHGTPGYEKKEIARLLQDAEQGRFDGVIVNDADRWSRDNESSQSGLRLLRDLKIRFFTGATEWDLTNAAHMMFLGMSAVVGEFFALNQMRKSLENRIARAKRGIPTGGKLPYGRRFIRSEDRQTGRWEIDPDKHRIITECAKRYLTCKGGVEGVAKEYGMNASHLLKVLTKTSGTEWQLEFKSKILNIDETVQMEIPRLLDDDIIETIRARSKSNRTYHRQGIKHSYLFARVIFCEHCGYALEGQINHSGRKYYRHTKNKRKVQCPGPQRKAWVPAAILDDNAFRYLFETFGNPAAVERAIKAATPNSERIKEASRELERVTKELQKTVASIQRVVAVVAEGKVSREHTERQLTKLNDREATLKQQKAKLEDELSTVPSRVAIAIKSKEVAAKFRNYVNVRVQANIQHANEAFEEMTDAERRQLCEAVFSGKTAEGKRMGVSITWSEDGKKWRYRIDGILIERYGPTSKDGFVFGAVRVKDGLVGIRANC